MIHEVTTAVKKRLWSEKWNLRKFNSKWDESHLKQSALQAFSESSEMRIVTGITECHCAFFAMIFEYCHSFYNFKISNKTVLLCWHLPTKPMARNRAIAIRKFRINKEFTGKPVINRVYEQSGIYFLWFNTMSYEQLVLFFCYVM